MGIHHLFIVNPKAGKKDMSKSICEQVKKLRLMQPYEIVITQYKGHAFEIAKNAVEKQDNFVRIYSCGGDGTLNEVINGVYPHTNCAVGVVPIGSGNDFVRAFEPCPVSQFLDLKAMVKGEVMSIDLLSCIGKVSANVISVGYDCAVAKNMIRFKKLPLISGSMAYKISIIYCLFSKMRHYFDIVADEEKVKLNGKSYLLAVTGNGKYYGGGIKATPYGNLSNGKIEFIYVPTVSIFTLAKLLNTFVKGEHINNPKMPFIKYRRCEKVRFICEKSMDIGLDGEIYNVKNPEIEILHEAQKVIVPKVNGA